MVEQHKASVASLKKAASSAVDEFNSDRLGRAQRSVAGILADHPAAELLLIGVRPFSPDATRAKGASVVSPGHNVATFRTSLAIAITGFIGSRERGEVNPCMCSDCRVWTEILLPKLATTLTGGTPAGFEDSLVYPPPYNHEPKEH